MPHRAGRCSSVNERQTQLLRSHAESSPQAPRSKPPTCACLFHNSLRKPSPARPWTDQQPDADTRFSAHRGGGGKALPPKASCSIQQGHRLQRCARTGRASQACAKVSTVTEVALHRPRGCLCSERRPGPAAAMRFSLSGAAGQCPQSRCQEGQRVEGAGCEEPRREVAGPREASWRRWQTEGG